MVRDSHHGYELTAARHVRQQHVASITRRVYNEAQSAAEVKSSPGIYLYVDYAYSAREYRLNAYSESCTLPIRCQVEKGPTCPSKYRRIPQPHACCCCSAVHSLTRRFPLHGAHSNGMLGCCHVLVCSFLCHECHIPGGIFYVDQEVGRKGNGGCLLPAVNKSEQPHLPDALTIPGSPT